MAKKRYLGDAVYVEVEESTSNVVLTTEDGISATNTIVLEPGVLEAFLTYISEVAFRDERPVLDA